jgi:PhnB protein
MGITPYLLYEDAGAALTWLAKAFGFRQGSRPMKGPDGKVSHADMRLGEHAIMLGGPAGSYMNPKRLGGATVLLYVDIDDVEKLFRRAVKAGATVVEEPKNTEYGARRCGVDDPEGHRWYFAQTIAKPKKGKKKGAKRATKARRK